MTKTEKEETKKRLIAEIISTRGFKTLACSSLGVNPRTFRKWVAEDAKFRSAVADAVEIARELRDDIAEQKLFGRVEAGDTTAIIFYCKTRLKDRGYSEKAQPAKEPKDVPALPPKDAEERAKRMARKVESKRRYLVRLLTKQGKYTAELTYQAEITARLLVSADMLEEEISRAGGTPIRVEYSREGNERVSIDPRQRLYLETLQKAQRSLASLGMNFDSKERKNDGEDGFTDFLNRFKDEEGEQ